MLLSLSTGKDADGHLMHEDPLISAIYADGQNRLRESRHLVQMIKTLDQIRSTGSAPGKTVSLLLGGLKSPLFI